ncbi:MAG: EamA family transporter, partial [Candidatus Omnitrophica bacterium]|nr:EamA family transporter [Candidatus Omnitrophota bacterium]
VTIILTIASICFFKALKVSDMSISMPMLTFTPVFLLITSPIMLGEFPQAIGLLGILLIVAGAYVINFSDRKIGYFEPFKSLLKEKGPRYMLVVAVLYSIGANFDKMAVVKYSMFAYLCAVNSCVSLVIFLIVLNKSKNIIAQFKFGWPYMLLMGICTTIAFFSQMSAIQMTIVPYVIAIKRTSVVMSSLFGIWIFKEKGFKERIIGVIVMIIGVFIISFYG